MKKVCLYACCDTCHPAPDNLANEDSLPDNEDIALASMKTRDERVTTKDAAPNSNKIAAAAIGGRPSTHSKERPQHVQESLVDSMGSGYPAIETGAHMGPSGVDPNDKS